jgi:hypothetical protein
VVGFCPNANEVAQARSRDVKNRVIALGVFA